RLADGQSALRLPIPPAPRQTQPAHSSDRSGIPREQRRRARLDTACHRRGSPHTYPCLRRALPAVDQIGRLLIRIGTDRRQAKGVALVVSGTSDLMRLLFSAECPSVAGREPLPKRTANTGKQSHFKLAGEGASNPCTRPHDW